MYGNSASTGGANAGNSLSAGVKGFFGATEDVRKGINNFFDNTIQPRAEKDREAGVTARHATHTGSAANETSSSGFSKDAEALGNTVTK